MSWPEHRLERVEGLIADAPADGWLMRWAPLSARPYLLLMRADRPIGTWLLLWPCWWSLALAIGAPIALDILLQNMLLFTVGAFVMRGAGCTYNDIVDRDIDAKVARTRGRPLPAGAVRVGQAIGFMLLLCLVGLLVLIQFNSFTIMLGISSLGLIALYPFLKRITYWPQLGLGLVFNWGALMGWASIHATVSWACVWLYIGCVFWTLGYDTIYAHQDKEDDLAIGVKSTALRFGAASPYWVAGFYMCFMLSVMLAAWLAGIGAIGFTCLAAAAVLLGLQSWRLEIDNSAQCLKLFRSNRDVGILIFAGLLLDQIVTHLMV